MSSACAKVILVFLQTFEDITKTMGKNAWEITGEFGIMHHCKPFLCVSLGHKINSIILRIYIQPFQELCIFKMAILQQLPTKILFTIK